MNLKNICIIIGVCLVTNTFSQDSLTHYLLIAAKNNPTVLQRLNEYQAALQKVPQVGGLPDPELSAGIFLSPMELVMGKQVADLRLMQMFPWFGTLRNARDEMSLMANGAYEAFIDAKLQVYYEVQSNWYNLYKLQQNILISEKNIDLLQSIERIALVRFTSASTGAGSSTSASSGQPASSQGSSVSLGMDAMNSNNKTAGKTSGGSQSPMQPNMQVNTMESSSGSSLTDLYRIRIEIADLNNNVLLLKNEFITLTAKFNSYLNRIPDTPVVLPDTLLFNTPRLSLTHALDSIFANNPMLKMLNYEQKSLEARGNMVRKMGYPMVGLGLNYSVINKNERITAEMNGKDMVMPMISLTLPVYRKKYKAQQSEVDFLKSSTSQNYTAAANDLRTQFYQAMQAHQDAKRRIELYKVQSELIQRTFQIMLQGFAVTIIDLTDVLRVRQQLLDYEYKQVEAVVDFNISVAWLKRLMAIQQIQ
jgi:outer membrane protein TolC